MFRYIRAFPNDFYGNLEVGKMQESSLVWAEYDRKTILIQVREAHNMFSISFGTYLRAFI